MKPMLTVVGLTGGIASGKSTVARIMRDEGLPVIDADALGHLVLEPDGLAYDQVLEIFGTGILGVDGRSIDRQKLGKMVFDNPSMRTKLEAITHPAIGILAKQGLMLIAQRGEKLAVYEAALLVETEIYKNMEALIVVSCSVENQMKRICARDKFSKEASAARIASQLPLSEKTAVADYVVENEGTPEELVEQVRSLVTELRTRFAKEGE